LSLRDRLSTIYRTHFGAAEDVAGEIDRFEEVMERGPERPAMISEFSARMREWALEIGLSRKDTLDYELANPRAMSVDG
jgi:hypothetical protein